MLRSEFMNGLVKDNNLYHEEDLFEFKRNDRSIWIIKRQGIEKIQYNNGITVRFEVIVMQPNYAVIKAIATKGDLVIESFGESTPENTKQKPPYHSAMAEKRGLSRVVLKAVGAYKFGIMGEDEADDFKEKSR
jgi:hypothetical protein